MDISNNLKLNNPSKSNLIIRLECRAPETQPSLTYALSTCEADAQRKTRQILDGWSQNELSSLPGKAQCFKKLHVWTTLEPLKLFMSPCKDFSRAQEILTWLTLGRIIGLQKMSLRFFINFNLKKICEWKHLWKKGTIMPTPLGQLSFPTREITETQLLPASEQRQQARHGLPWLLSLGWDKRGLLWARGCRSARPGAIYLVSGSSQPFETMSKTSIYYLHITIFSGKMFWNSSKLHRSNRN